MELWRKCEIQLAMFVRNRTQVDPQLAVRTDLQCVSLPQVVTRAEGKVHSLTLRNVTLAEAGEVRLAAKDFQTKANLIVKGMSLLPSQPLLLFPFLIFLALSFLITYPLQFSSYFLSSSLLPFPSS